MGGGVSAHQKKQSMDQLMIKFASLDTNGDGRVNLEELLAMHNEVEPDAFDEAKITAEFEQMDTDKSGSISFQEYLVQQGFSPSKAFAESKMLVPSMVCSKEDPTEETQEILTFFDKYKRPCPTAALTITAQSVVERTSLRDTGTKMRKYTYRAREKHFHVDIPLDEYLRVPFEGLTCGHVNICPAKDGIERFTAREIEDDSLAYFLAVSLQGSQTPLMNAIAEYASTLEGMPDNAEFTGHFHMSIPGVPPEALEEGAATAAAPAAAPTRCELVFDQGEDLMFLERPLARVFLNDKAVESASDYMPHPIDSDHSIYDFHELNIDDAQAKTLVKDALDAAIAAKPHCWIASGPTAATADDATTAAADEAAGPAPAAEPAAEPAAAPAAESAPTPAAE